MDISDLISDICVPIEKSINKLCGCIRFIDGFTLCMLISLIIFWSIFAGCMFAEQNILNQEDDFYKKNYQGTCTTIDSYIDETNICDPQSGCKYTYSLYCLFQGIEPNIDHASELILMSENNNKTIVIIDEINKCADYYNTSYTCYVNKNSDKIRLEVPTYSTDTYPYDLLILLFGIFGGTLGFTMIIMLLCIIPNCNRMRYNNIN